MARLRAFRAIDTLSALSIHLELGADWTRFQKPHRFGAWLGLTPSLNQSDQSSVNGPITKTGSTLAHRLLIEFVSDSLRERMLELLARPDVELSEHLV